MRRLRLLIEYDGTDFSGWQRQQNAPSIQATIEDALAGMTRTRLFVRGAGRTDAGVHALGQVGHFDTETAIPITGFLRGLNSAIPRTIAIREVSEVSPDFDARRSARGKLYRYRILNQESRSALRDRFVWHLRRPLDVGRMQEAAQHLVGRHDFSAFRAADCDRRTTVRSIHRLAIERAGDETILEVEGDAFLKHMVRILTGTLVAVGHGKLTPDEVERIREAGDRRQAGVTAPSKGLTLVRVDY